MSGMLLGIRENQSETTVRAASRKMEIDVLFSVAHPKSQWEARVL